ncbi:hypothetical protein BDZ97DRAFT_1752224 [Flammula alnicola]|nr:hypothetical protein BDZ97DRAFT_1752224 [Flammula alnicola]
MDKKEMIRDYIPYLLVKRNGRKVVEWLQTAIGCQACEGPVNHGVNELAMLIRIPLRLHRAGGAACSEFRYGKINNLWSILQLENVNEQTTNSACFADVVIDNQGLANEVYTTCLNLNCTECMMVTLHGQHG